MRNVYRKAALERMSSPDRLDTMLKITTPQSWIALAAAAALAAAVVLWSFAGSLPETVTLTGTAPEDGAPSLFCPVQPAAARQIRPGMEARVYDAVTGEYRKAQVTEILSDAQELFSADEPVSAVVCTFEEAPVAEDGMLAGEQTGVQIIVSRSAPIAKVFPVFGGGQ